MLSHWPLRIEKHPSWKATDFKGAMAGTAEDQSQNGNVLLCPGGFFPFGKLVGTLKDSLFFLFFEFGKWCNFTTPMNWYVMGLFVEVPYQGLNYF